MILRHSTKFEARVALHPGETRGELRRMAGEFYGVVALIAPTIHGQVAVVLFGNADHASEFRVVRAVATLAAYNR